jgi:hypothetical protein
MVVAELNARENLEQREIGLEVTLQKQNLSQKNQNLSLVSM